MVPAYGVPPQYGAPPQYGYAYGAPPVIQRNNGMAIASMVCSLVGILFCLTSPLGIIFGHIALSQIKASRGAQGGRGMAITGLVVGYIVLAFWVVFFIVSASSSNNNTNY